jgi:hypothetical protein
VICKILSEAAQQKWLRVVRTNQQLKDETVDAFRESLAGPKALGPNWREDFKAGVYTGGFPDRLLALEQEIKDFLMSNGCDSPPALYIGYTAWANWGS